MPEFCITETLDDPSLTPHWVGWARDELHALDQWADSIEMARYSDVLMDPETHEDEKDGLVNRDADGVVWAIFSNTWVYVLPTHNEIEERMYGGDAIYTAVSDAIADVMRQIRDDVAHGAGPDIEADAVAMGIGDNLADWFSLRDPYFDRRAFIVASDLANPIPSDSFHR